MMDYVPAAENPAMGPAQALYGPVFFLALARSFFLALALALRGGAITRARAKLARWLSVGARPSPVSQIREEEEDTPPRRVPPVLLNPAQLAAATAALEFTIADGRRPVESLRMRRVDSPDSDSSSDDDDGGGGGESSGRPRDRHLSFPLIQDLAAGDARLFFAPGSAPGLPDAGVRRLSDVHENPWILKADAENFAGPLGLTNETTQTWIMRLKITTKLVGLSKQQLHEQNWEQYFSEVAGQSLEQLLVVACSFSDAIWSQNNISQMLTVFEALVDVLFNIQDLPFSRSGEVAGIVNKMVNAFKGVIQGSVIRISKKSSKKPIEETSIHPATYVLVQGLQFFCRNRRMVQPILESGDYNTGPCSDMLNCLISKLEEFAKVNFHVKGQRYLFVLNNIYYVVQKKCHPGLLLPPNVASKLDSLVDQYIMGFLDEYWFPLILSYLEDDSLKKPCRSSLKTFIDEFFSMCNSQMTWKVQSELRGILREEIVKLIVPKYVNFLKALQERRSSHRPWLKWMSRARSEKPAYTADRLELVVKELFEG